MKRTVQPEGWVKVAGLAPDGQHTVVLFGRDGASDSAHCRIHASSLLGQLLVGRRVGETVVFEAAHGSVRLRILDAGTGDYAHEPQKAISIHDREGTLRWDASTTRKQ